jgi:hypothetical protein
MNSNLNDVSKDLTARLNRIWLKTALYSLTIDIIGTALLWFALDHEFAKVRQAVAEVNRHLQERLVR